MRTSFLLLLVPLLGTSDLSAQDRRVAVEARSSNLRTAAGQAPLESLESLESLEERVRASFDPAGAFDDASRKDVSFDPAGGFDLASPGIVSSGPPIYAAGTPANNSCLTATVIPGNAITYSNFVDTSGATNFLCDSATGCESGGVGTSNSVWWTYTPDADGTIIVDTLGSDFDTVLSVFDGCRFYNIFSQSCQGNPLELACNDDYFFGPYSRVALSVQGGSTYLIKVATVGTNAGGGNCDFDLIYVPPNDACSTAEVVPGTAWDPPLRSTHWASIEPCEADESCEFNNVGVSNSVWYSYLAPCDGLLSVNTNGSSYDTLLSIFDGCGEFVGVDQNCILPTEIACDDDSGTGLQSQLVDVPVQAGVEYRIKVSDYNTAQGGGYLDFNLLFTASSPPVAAIASPVDLGCACGVETITGTATAGNGPLAQWHLEYRPLSTSAWTLIQSDNVAVNGGTLATWDTNSLAHGTYLLRLTVENGCGFAATDARVVLVDQAFDDLELRAPNGGVFGGRLPIDGTAWDSCFASYDVEVRALGDPNWKSIGASPYATTVIDDPLIPGGWDSSQVVDGDWVLRVSGVDQCGNPDSESTTITIDNTPPVAEIVDPVGCQLWRGVVRIVGTAADANLDSWQLEYTGGVGEGWTLLAQGTSSVVDDVLAYWNVSGLPDCAYTLRLTVVSDAILDGDDRAVAVDLVSGATYPSVLQPGF